MKGFIELSSPNDEHFKISIKIKNIIKFMDMTVYYEQCNTLVPLNVRETHEEIKQLIREAQ